MKTLPAVSFIVLSYNYRKYVVETIRSILLQTFQDFEIIVIDDRSPDDSADVIGSFSDQRIKLVVNEQNMGGTASYNKAVNLCQGEYIVNLDSDDWIDPEKTEKQLHHMRNSNASVVGTYITTVDADGNIHPDDVMISEYCNNQINTADPLNWVGKNTLCRSSTMIRRADHLSVGLDDEDMLYACDYELWTRFLKNGFKIDVIPEKLTYYRMHGRNITHKNPAQQYLEICYLMAENLSPLIEKTASYNALSDMIRWAHHHEQFASLSPIQRYRLIYIFLSGMQFGGFSHFCAFLSSVDRRELDDLTGRRVLALLRNFSS